jgi:acetyl-CoA synthetase
MSADTILEARNFLVAHRTDYATAYRDFRWPSLTNFNWALDLFDAVLANGLRALGVIYFATTPN